MSSKKSILLLVGIMILVSVVLILSLPPTFTDSRTSSYFSEGDNFEYNVSKNVTDPENDTLTFYIDFVNSSYHDSKDPSDYAWIQINETNGMLTFNASNDNETGEYNLTIRVQDPDPSGTFDLFFYFINATNDAPNFTQIQSEYNMSQAVQSIFDIIGEDEATENHYPLFYNLTFVNCTLANYSTRTNCTLLDINNSYSNTTGRIVYTPVKNDVGSYTVNISVMDNAENFTCITGYCDPSYSNNLTTYYDQLITFNVLSNVEINASNCQDKIFQENETGSCNITVYSTGSDDGLNLSSIAYFRNYAATPYNITWFYPNSTTTSSNYVVEFEVNITPLKREVGNWTINFSAYDVSYDENTTEQIYIYVNRSYNDAPEISTISNQIIPKNYFTEVDFNSFDDDLLILDANEANGGYDEILSFVWTAYNQSDLSQQMSLSNFTISIINMPVSGTNRTVARIGIKGNDSEVGDYTINISVSDKDGANDYRLFNLTIIDNSPPQWNANLNDTLIGFEDSEFYYNVSLNVTDSDNDVLTFSSSIDNSFPSFSMGSDGVMNFTPNDFDVGYHLVTVNVTDGYFTNITTFNFTINNINDSLVIDKPIINIINGSVDLGSNITTAEDNRTVVELWVYDDDYNIPSAFKSYFYEENITLNLSIAGPNNYLFNFLKDISYPNGVVTNASRFTATFTPNKSDVGAYYINLTAFDQNYANDTLQFNLTIIELDHAPIIYMENFTLFINNSLYHQINAYDFESGNSSEPNVTNFTFGYTFISGNDFINGDETIFNTTNGILNYSFNDSDGGLYNINISVSDGTGQNTSDNFYIYVYDYPNLNYPDTNTTFYMTENVSTLLNFSVNHSVLNNLTYRFYITNFSGDYILKYVTNYYGNGSILDWNYTPDYLTETSNLTNYSYLRLVSYLSDSNLANNSQYNLTVDFNVSINHTNSPLTFDNDIGGVTKNVSGDSPVVLTLSQYFNDSDALDPLHFQTIGFVLNTYNISDPNATLGSMSYNLTNWTNGSSPLLTFYSTVASLGNYTVTGFEMNESNSSQVISNVTSNYFIVDLIISDDTPVIIIVPVPSSGGGGATKKEGKPYAFKLVTPGKISVFEQNKVVVPFNVTNTGKQSFKDIELTAFAYVNGDIESQIETVLSQDTIESLAVGDTESLTLDVVFNGVSTENLEILINATSRDPKYSDFGKILVVFDELQKSKAGDYILFVEEFIVENPECAEITEIVNEAKTLLDSGEYEKAISKAEEAVNACKRSIAQVNIPKSKVGGLNKIRDYFILAVFVSIVLGLLYYIITGWYFRRANREVMKEQKVKETPKIGLKKFGDEGNGLNGNGNKVGIH